MPQGVIATIPKFQFSANGVPMVGGTLDTYVAGTTTPATTWQDSALTIANTNPITLDARGECVLWLDPAIVYKFVLKSAAGVIQWTQDNISNPAALANTLRTDLAASSGASLVGFIQAGAAAVPRTEQAKSREHVSVADFGATGTGDETALVQAAFNYAIATSQKLYIDKPYTVSQIVVNGAAGLVIHSEGSLTGLPTGSYDAVLTIKNSSDVTTTGRLPVSAAFNSGYACAVAVYTDNATQAAKMDLGNIIVVGAKLGWRFSRSTEANALVSEIVVRGGYSYGCPSFCEAYGTQTVISFMGYQAITGVEGGPVGWNLLNRIHTRSIGANVRYIGGECLLTDVPTGIGFSLEPITDATYGNNYGTVECLGVDIEIASQLLVARNPAAVATPVAGKGCLNISNCSGVHTQNSFAWLVSASDFTGSIRVKNSKFFCTTSRTLANIDCSGNADIYVDDYSFGAGFVQGLSGFTGGILHFDRRKIVEAVNAASQALAAGVQATVKYANFNSDSTTGRFAANYNAATGVFTVPAGGLLDVEVFGSLHTTTPSQPLDLCAFVTGNQQVPMPTNTGGASSNGWISGHTFLGNLIAGATIDLRATQAGAASNSNGGALDKFIIYARN